MNTIRTILILSAMSLVGACATTEAVEEDPAMRFEKYQQCSAEHAPEKVAEMCGHILKTN
ncbi:MAG: hypothetical protein OEU36_11715 [Gammaproteobacteria bacterium]|nr:hypothetical protein [Gammaproteobacteria bacterium]